jgi:AmiR/NasT family two-component response regulator
MRVWLIEDRPEPAPESLKETLQQLATRPETGLVLQHAGPCQPELFQEMRLRLPEVVVLDERAWANPAHLPELLTLGAGVVVATTVEGCVHFLALAELHPILMVPARPAQDCLWLALVSARAAQRRAIQDKQELERLQQRLNDRIIIERAKGVLVQRLAISEEEAYKRLRMLSRKQRRHIRDIAQSLLDTQCLLSPGQNGIGGEHLLDAVPAADGE